MGLQVGTVERVQFTRSGVQLTAIDGECFATSFNLLNTPVKAGRRVEYIRSGTKSWAFDVEEADIIRVISEGE